MHILITAGGTREYIDPVRFISNASTGRMGLALARAAIRAGHKVTLITAPTSLRPPKDARTINVETSGEMFERVKENFGKCDCLIMAAAVSDYKPARQSKSKIKKDAHPLTIELKPTKDILKWAGRNKVKRKEEKGKIVVGFALEDKNLRVNAEKKLREKNLDMIIAKTPGSKWFKLTAKTKTATAKKIIRMIERLPG